MSRRRLYFCRFRRFLNFKIMYQQTIRESWMKNEMIERIRVEHDVNEQ